MAKTKKRAATVTTGLFCVAMLPGALMNLIQPPIAVEMAGTLGVPLAMLSLLGVWKLLGIAALATPGFARLKEWAYAGFVFDLTGAAVLHIAAGDPAGAPVPLVLCGLLLVSYWLRHAQAPQTSLKLAAT